MADSKEETVLGTALELPCGVQLPNRLVKAAMGEQLADPDTGDSTAELARLYQRWARGGSGTLITGVCLVERANRDYRMNVIDADTDVQALRDVADGVHAAGSVLVFQLGHMGAWTPRYATAQPVAPSALDKPEDDPLFFARPRALTGDEIEALVERFATAAQVCQQAGADGVELLATSWFLIGAFLSPAKNHRTDEWGGTLEGRSRFLRAIVARIREVTGPGFAIGVKMNAKDAREDGFDVGDAAAVAGMVAGLGADFIEWVDEKPLPSDPPHRVDQPVAHSPAVTRFVEASTALRAATSVPLILTGQLRSRAVMEHVIAEGLGDLVGLARPLVQEPDFPARLLAGQVDSIELVAPPTKNKSEENLQLVWYVTQFQRLADGKDFDPHYSANRMVGQTLSRAVRVGTRRTKERARRLLHTR